MPTINRLSALLAAVVWTVSTIAFAQDNNTDDKPHESAFSKLSQLDFSNRSLIGILWFYEQAGYNIIYSDRLIDPNMTTRNNVPHGDPIQRLASLLDNYYLMLVKDEYANSWYVSAGQNYEQALVLHIIDNKTGNALAGVEAIFQDEKIATSDDRGVISIPLTRADIPILLRKPQFDPLSIVPSNVANEDTLVMESTEGIFEQVLVTASQYHMTPSGNASNVEIPAYKLDGFPLRGGDVTQVLNVLPGTASSGVSAIPNIRGGAKNELLIVFDGVELINPFHLKDFYGLVSALSSDIVETVNIYTGGYPANYGSKMSGVMDIAPTENYTDQSNTLEWNAFTTSLKIASEYEPENIKGLLSLRRGNVDDILDQVNEDIGSPKFNDAYAKVSWQPFEDLEVTASILTLEDDVKLKDSDDFGNTENAQSRYISHYGWLKLKFNHGNYFDTEWLVSLADVLNQRRGETTYNGDANGSNGVLLDKRNYEILHISHEGYWDPNGLYSLEYGFGFEQKDGDYNYQSQAELSLLANLLGSNRYIQSRLDEEFDAIETYAYLNYLYEPLQSLKFIVGYRFDRQNLTEQDKYQYSPRLAAIYHWGPALTVKFSAGRYYQAPDIDELTIKGNDGYFESPQKSEHYIVGLEYLLTSALSMTAEVYRKSVLSPKSRYENLFNPYSLLPDISSDRVAVTPEKAKATGLEFKINYSPFPQLTSELSYSLSTVSDIINGQEYYRHWNQLHALQLSMDWRSNLWAVTAFINWHDGWRTTRLPNTVPNLTDQIEYRRNDTALPSFLTLNVKASYTWLLSNSDLQVYLDISNVTNRKNIGYYKVVSTENEFDQGFSLSKQQEALLPILPSVGIRWTF